MSHEKRADYSKRWLFPPSLEDWVSSDHPARFIREFVDAMDLRELGFRVRESEQGRPNYAADMLLKVWLYGYFQKIRSSRGLERACREAIGLVWLTGRNEPDHNTLWRFWKDNKKTLKKVFQESVRVAARAELVGMLVHAVDGTKIGAAGSRWKAWHRSDLEKWLARVDGSIDEVMEQVEQAEAKESGEYRLPAELCDPEKLRATIRQGLEELQRAGRDHVSKTDPEARMMKVGGKYEFGYNAQAVIDEQNGILVAAEVVTAEGDNHLLTPMVEEVEENLGRAAEETLADAGYVSGLEFQRLEEKGCGILVNLVEPNADDDYHHSRFRYDAEKDCCVCPRGEVLNWESMKKDRDGSPVRVYRCQSYRECPVRWQCSQNQRGRTVTISSYHDAWQRQKAKQAKPDKRAILARRGQLIERIFGWIKQEMGFRRWTVRGLAGVQSQWALLCTTVNLRILYRFWRNRLIAV
jgi:transposase